jgi:putative lipoprotein (rSAM/lipoprotein system)
MVILSGCSAVFDFIAGDYNGNIQGIVTDTDGNPINHIKVTLSTEDAGSQISVYTSSKGEFVADMEWTTEEGSNTLNVILEDIDDEENGGLFDTLTDQVIVLDEKSKVITLTYQMTLATSSASIRQSL